jgi:phage terminase small subunit
MILAKGLRAKQRKFIEYYDGNATKTAMIAGYKSPKYAANSLLKNELIIDKIREREKTNPDPLIATVVERKRFLTSVMRDEKQDMSHRIKSTELLCKMNADFTTKVEVADSTDDIFRREIRLAAMDYFNNMRNAANYHEDTVINNET